eukprot:scaffold56165_cov35-Phaeocystis_antarctica.AAC.1
MPHRPRTPGEQTGSQAGLLLLTRARLALDSTRCTPPGRTRRYPLVSTSCATLGERGGQARRSGATPAALSQRPSASDRRPDAERRCTAYPPPAVARGRRRAAVEAEAEVAAQ